MPKFSWFKKKSPVKEQASKAFSLIKKLLRVKLVKITFTILAIGLTLPWVLFFVLKPQPLKDITYGANFSDVYARDLGLDWKQTYLQILDDLKVKNLRLVVYWNEVEKTKDLYDFSNILWQMEEARKRGVSVILVLGRKVPRYPECHEPTWWKEIKSQKLKEAKLYSFVEHTVTTLRGFENIKMWQVENEPFFPFGECEASSKKTIEEEIKIVRSLDERPIIVQDSGEGGFWHTSYLLGDYLAISMYRKIWYDFWGIFFGRFIYFEYPLAHWSYKIKADIVGVPYQRIIVTELQAEPWGPGINSSLSDEEKDRSMSRNDFLNTISYAQKTGFKDLYFWGVEWWYWEKEKNNNPYFWDVGKALFN